MENNNGMAFYKIHVMNKRNLRMNEMKMLLKKSNDTDYFHKYIYCVLEWILN